MKKKKIKTGKIEIGINEFNPRKGKFRVNMFVDLDVIDEIRKLASKEHMPYQTWINRKLRAVVDEYSISPISPEEIVNLVDKRIGEYIEENAIPKTNRELRTPGECVEILGSAENNSENQSNALHPLSSAASDPPVIKIDFKRKRRLS